MLAFRAVYQTAGQGLSQMSLLFTSQPCEVGQEWEWERLLIYLFMLVDEDTG